MLLSNITIQTAACAKLLALKIPVVRHTHTYPPFYPPQSRSGSSPAPVPYIAGETVEVPALSLLVQAFVQAAAKPPQKESVQPRKADLHFLATVFSNVTMVWLNAQYFAQQNVMISADNNWKKIFYVAKGGRSAGNRFEIRKTGISTVGVSNFY